MSPTVDLQQDHVSRLLGAIEGDQLVVLCGAGLSMAMPSRVPSAASLAQSCARKYELYTGSTLLPELKVDLEKLAGQLLSQNLLKTLFVRKLVDWSPFHKDPNPGHFSVADFLAAHVIESAVTTNLDSLIEEAAKTLGEPCFEAALDGPDAERSRDHQPLLKLHGCSVRDKENTLWCASQLDNEQTIADRIERSKEWLLVKLRGKTLVFVGFWSDWAYLNTILESCVSAVAPQNVFLVDPGDEDQLAAKAPRLWSWAHGANMSFFHIQQSGSDFLDALRGHFCRQFLDRIVDGSVDTYKSLFGANPGSPRMRVDLPTGDLYDMRRDACGVPVGQVVRKKRPDLSMQTVGAFHIRLQVLGAAINDSVYSLSGRRIRVISGAGQVLSEVRLRFAAEPERPIGDDIVICAGADDDGGAPLDLVRGGTTGNILRPGLSERWLTTHGAKDFLAGVVP